MPLGSVLFQAHLRVDIFTSRWWQNRTKGANQLMLSETLLEEEKKACAWPQIISVFTLQTRRGGGISPPHACCWVGKKKHPFYLRDSVTHQDRRHCSETEDCFRGLCFLNSTRLSSKFIIQGIFRPVVGMNSENVNHLLSYYMDDLMVNWGPAESDCLEEKDYKWNSSGRNLKILKMWERCSGFGFQEGGPLISGVFNYWLNLQANCAWSNSRTLL